MWTKKKKNDYNKIYYRNYKRKYPQTKKFNTSILDGYVFFQLNNAPEYVTFSLINERMLEIKEQRCTICKLVLNMTEKLYGNNCQTHSIGQIPNINNLGGLPKIL